AKLIFHVDFIKKKESAREVAFLAFVPCHSCGVLPARYSAGVSQISFLSTTSFKIATLRSPGAQMSTRARKLT
ncbi:MAG: hypothetical protein ABWY25_01665, partial [Paenisporosarcina sp.]